MGVVEVEDAAVFGFLGDGSEERLIQVEDIVESVNGGDCRYWI